MHMHGKLDLRLLTGQPCELGGLQKVLEGTPGYAEQVTGHPPETEAAQNLLRAVPPGVIKDSKYVYGFVIDGPEMIGCADIIRGWPESSTAVISLLLLGEAYQGYGLGRSSYDLVEAKVRRWPEIDMIRISVPRAAAAVLPFWHRMGFSETGELQPYVHGDIVSESVILTKPLL